VRNIITSMRMISDMDWAELFERISLVDETLADSSGFSSMDFPTRNLYRSAIEELARGSELSEIEVAREAALVAKAAEAGGDAVDQERRADPGYHLLAGGRSAFDALIKYRPSWRAWPGRRGRAFGIKGYLCAIGIVAAGILALPILICAANGLSDARLVLLGALGVLPAIDVAVTLVNRGVVRAFGPIVLPALELRDGVPSELRTLVAVPMMLTSRATIDELVERLEIHHLANSDDELHFALVSDWVDSVTEQNDSDADLLAVAISGVADLNRRYGEAPGGERFLLLHRRRVWNAGENRWIGWERKRGKLHELNRLLRGETDTTFMSLNERPPRVPKDIRYVVTIDADTRLPRDTIRRLIGKMAHPLNRPRFDPVSARIVDGHAILQPRVTPSLPVGREGSLFQRAYSSLGGIDPYSGAVSDVYQDLFGEGSYTGKGIYDIDAFELALAGRAPDSSLLSHDLFEGVFARAGLASDIEVVEEFPARYDVAAVRAHRWARGDWQLLPWIVGCGPNVAAGHRPAAVPTIGRWKMLDNLRRTMSAPAAVATLLVGLVLPIKAAIVWVAFAILTIVLPVIVPVIGALIPSRGGTTMRSCSGARHGYWLALAQSGLVVVFSPIRRG
jgi:cyclic beta-1,2-glucan synthetase